VLTADVDGFPSFTTWNLTGQPPEITEAVDEPASGAVT
jgi:hypothetical protein